MQMSSIRTKWFYDAREKSASTLDAPEEAQHIATPESFC
jgi:hypothetical protein